MRTGTLDCEPVSVRGHEYFYTVTEFCGRTNLNFVRLFLEMPEEALVDKPRILISCETPWHCERNVQNKI